MKAVILTAAYDLLTFIQIDSIDVRFSSTDVDECSMESEKLDEWCWSGIWSAPTLGQQEAHMSLPLITKSRLPCFDLTNKGFRRCTHDDLFPNPLMNARVDKGIRSLSEYLRASQVFDDKQAAASSPLFVNSTPRASHGEVGAHLCSEGSPNHQEARTRLTC